MRLMCVGHAAGEGKEVSLGDGLTSHTFCETDFMKGRAFDCGLWGQVVCGHDVGQDSRRRRAGKKDRATQCTGGDRATQNHLVSLQRKCVHSSWSPRCPLWEFGFSSPGKGEVFWSLSGPEPGP